MASGGEQSPVENGRHVCSKCKKNFSSNRRLAGHIGRHDQDNENTTGNKDDCYTKLAEPGKYPKYSCYICHILLSSKQRIDHHLNRIHGKSPAKMIYNRWKNDVAASIPKTTYFRHRNSLSFRGQAGGSNELDDFDMTSEINDLSDSDNDISEIMNSDEEGQISNDLEGRNSSNSEGGHANVDTLQENTDIQINSMNDGYDELSNEEPDSENEYLFLSDEDDSEKDCLSSSNNVSEEEGLAQYTNKDMLSESESHSYCKIAFAIKHNISGEGGKDLRTLLNICSKSDDKNQFDLPYEKAKYSRVHYCILCNALFPDDVEEFTCTTVGCQNLRYQGGVLSQTMPNRRPKASFVLADVESQLRQILGKKGMWEAIQLTKAYTSQPAEFISDLTDGDCYRQLCQLGQFLANTNHLSAVFNTDGIPLYSSSKVKLWPIFLAINEIPVSSRFARENILLAAIWQGKGNPPFIQYLDAFGQRMNDLYERGIDIRVGDGNVLVRVAVICSTMDLQAKAYVANMTMHNGEYGCCTCEEPGIVVSQGKGHARCYPYRATEEKPQLIRSDDIVHNKAPIASKQRRQKGICGISGLSVMPYFDMVDGLLPDYTHGILLGVTKSLLSLWFSPTNSKKPFFIGNHLNTISSRLQQICPPDYIERLPRDLEKHYANFKATELQTWLLFYAIPCLSGMLSRTYFDHLCLLSEGVYILLSDNITVSDLEKAATVLDEFYEYFQELYSDGGCGLNIHNTGAHLTSYVKKWGPLWAWSCFPFEDANAAILQAVHGTGDICVQYLNLKHLQGILSNLELDKCHSQEIKLFLGKMQKCDRKWSSTKPMSNCVVAGAMHAVKNEEAGDEVLTATRTVQSTELKKVLRVEIGGQKLYSEQYGRMKRRVCDTVCMKNGKLLQIMYFVMKKDTQVVYAVGKQILLDDECFVNERCLHIIKVRTSDVTVVADVSMISEKVFHIVVDNDRYVCRMPNILGRSIFK